MVIVGKISKAVIPAAGLGTRFLPATKALPKEMLPIIDTPVMQYVVEEAVGAGVPHILMVTGRNKNALENHFDRAVELENLLANKGDSNKLSQVVISTELADIHYVRQGDPKGLGHAVLKAKSFVGEEPFALLLGDEIIDDSHELLQKMIEVAERKKCNVVGLLEVSANELHKYGIAELGETQGDGVVSIKGFVEKPSDGNAPSNFAIIGRYVLQPGVFEVLESTVPGFAGEIQLTDALSAMAKQPTLAGEVVGVVFSGIRHDTGDKLSFLKATVEIASRRSDLGAEFTSWLKSFVMSR